MVVNALKVTFTCCSLGKKAYRRRRTSYRPPGNRRLRPYCLSDRSTSVAVGFLRRKKKQFKISGKYITSINILKIDSDDDNAAAADESCSSGFRYQLAVIDFSISRPTAR